MLHERVSEAEFTPAAWPSTLETLVIAERFANADGMVASDGDVRTELALAERTAAAPDIPAGVGRLIVAAYVGLVLALFAFFTGSFLAAMVVTIAAGFVAIFFAVPRIFFALEPDQGRRPSLGDFFYDGVQTLTGHCKGKDALVQMLIVPVLLTLGLLAMGIVGAIYL